MAPRAPDTCCIMAFVIFATIFQAHCWKFEIGNPERDEGLRNVFFQMNKIGTYADPVTGIVKDYFTDGVSRSWAASKQFCQSLNMQSASPQSNAEMQYITGRTGTPCPYYWSSGIQKFYWNIDPKVPIYNNPEWSTPPATPQCGTLHMGLNIHPFTCDTNQCTLCEQILGRF